MSVSQENRVSLPAEFLSLAQESLGKTLLDTLLQRLNNGRSLPAVRLNPFKFPPDGKGGKPIEEQARELFGENIEGPVPWCSGGFYLKERLQFTLDPLFHAGAYYVQEASGMYLDLIQEAIERECKQLGESSFFARALTALDLCAAPGGKTTHLTSILSEGSLLVANEVIKNRATILADQVAKWGLPRVMVTQNDPKEFERLLRIFDLVIADVPCSGEGLFGKEPDAVREWSLPNVKLCCERQKRILADIWPALKPGGFLVYSTCTYNHFENDDHLRYLQEELGALLIRLEAPAGSGIWETPQGGLQFVPGRVEGEGQFVALLRKPEFTIGRSVATHIEGRKKEQKGGRKGGRMPRCLFSPKGYETHLQGDFIIGLPSPLAGRILFLKGMLRTVLSGVAIASVKGADFIPHADLALLAGGGFTGIPAVELSKEEALRFLAKEPLLFADAPLGYLWLTYRGRGLGFVKNLGNRSNNLLPMARRIRMDINL